MRELFAEVFRVLKPDTHFYLFCDAETMFVAKPEAERAGFRFWKPLVWDKRTIGMGYHYRARYEFILFFEKGKRRLNDLGVADIITVPRIHRGYPAEKPATVSEIVIGQSSHTGRRRGRSVHGIRQRRRRGASSSDADSSAPISIRRPCGWRHSGCGSSGRQSTSRALLGERARPSRAHGFQTMTGAAYADLVAFYVSRRFEDRGLKVYREIQIGKTIIGKNRHVDIFCVCERTNRAFAIECKFQESIGTVDEKIPYALDDLKALPMAGCIAYAGGGFSDGVLHMLEASPHAAYCMPTLDQSEPSADTRELDHLMAMHFEWWDVLVGSKRPVFDQRLLLS